MLSFLYPIFDRAELFLATLVQHVAQSHRRWIDYEILVLDDGSTTTAEADLTRHLFIQSGLPLRYIRLDTTKLPFPIYRHAGANNPAAAWNVGALLARGDRLVISSPEIAFRTPDCLLRLATWAQGPREALIADVYDATWAATEFAGWIGGGEKQRALNFLAVYPREHVLRIGGFDLTFMRGCAYEDVEFLDRWRITGGTFAFTGQAVTAEHQWHERPEGERADANERNRQYYVSRQGQHGAAVDMRNALACVEASW